LFGIASLGDKALLAGYRMRDRPLRGAVAQQVERRAGCRKARAGDVGLLPADGLIDAAVELRLLDRGRISVNFSFCVASSEAKS
jgi:hypothetical protein